MIGVRQFTVVLVVMFSGCASYDFTVPLMSYPEEQVPSSRVCHVHNQALKRCNVNILRGPWRHPRNYWEYRENHFPFAGDVFAGCISDPDDPRDIKRWTCSECRKAFKHYYAALLMPFQGDWDEDRIPVEETISVGLSRTETLRRLRQRGAIEVPKDVAPDAKGWAIPGRSDCLLLSFTDDVLAGIGVERNADKPKIHRSWHETNTTNYECSSSIIEKQSVDWSNANDLPCRIGDTPCNLPDDARLRGN